MFGPSPYTDTKIKSILLFECGTILSILFTMTSRMFSSFSSVRPFSLGFHLILYRSSSLCTFKDLATSGDVILSVQSQPNPRTQLLWLGMASLLQPDRVVYLVRGEKKLRAPLSQLYFCRYCSELRSLECVSHEVGEHFRLLAS